MFSWQVRAHTLVVHKRGNVKLNARRQCVRIAISWRGYDGSGSRNHKSGGAKQAASGGDSGNDDGGQEEQRRGWAGMMPALWYS
jgi:hypothetical protein